MPSGKPWLRPVPAPPPVLVEIEIEALRALLDELYSWLRAAPSDPPPAGAEVRFGPATADPADRDEDAALSTSDPVPVPGLPFEVRLSGRIDRLDRDGDRARVVDYKTGKPEPYRRRTGTDYRVAGGERLQLPVYALAARHLGASRVASAYLFVRYHEGEPKVTEIALRRRRDRGGRRRLKEALVLMDEAVRSGLYLPKTTSLRSGNPCGYLRLRRRLRAGTRPGLREEVAGRGRARLGDPSPKLEEIP